MIDPGRLDTLITFNRPGTATVNAAGETVVPLEPEYGGVWAEVIQPSALEQIRNGVTTTQEDYAILIRWRDDITTGWTITHEGKTLHIRSVSPIGRKEFLTIRACAEVQS